MTSEAFVYLMLPGTTRFVTAGRVVLSADPLGVMTGRFVYGRRYLAREEAVPIDPIELKLGSRTYETQRMHSLFGALRDAGPDFWGRRIIEQHAGKPMASELDYLLHSPDDRAGALGFGLNAEPPAHNASSTRRSSLHICRHLPINSSGTRTNPPPQHHTMTRCPNCFFSEPPWEEHGQRRTM